MKAITAEITGLMTGAGVPCLLHETDEHGPHAVWYNQQGGDRNWIIINLKNVGTTAVSSLKLRLAYAASGEACAPKSAKGDKPLLVQQSEPSELAALSLARGAAHATSVRISDLSGAHQKRRFVVEILGGAEVIGTTKPIEVRARNPAVGRKRMLEQKIRRDSGTSAAAAAAAAYAAGPAARRPRLPAAVVPAAPSAAIAPPTVPPPASRVNVDDQAQAHRDALITLLASLPHEQQRQVHGVLGKMLQQTAKSRFRKVVNTIIFMKRAGRRAGLRPRPMSPADVPGPAAQPGPLPGGGPSGGVPDPLWDWLNSPDTEEWLQRPETEQWLQQKVGPLEWTEGVDGEETKTGAV